MIADPEIVQAMLRAVEQKHATRGWDVPPSMWLLGAHGRPGIVHELPFPAAFWEGRTVDALWRIARPNGGTTAEVLSMFNPAGLALVCEAWELVAKPGQPRLARPIADTPGSVEVRYALAVDSRGDLFQVHRVRGTEPDVHRWAGADPEQPYGPIAAMLRLLAIDTFLRLPAGSHDIAALAAHRDAIAADPVGWRMPAADPVPTPSPEVPHA